MFVTIASAAELPPGALTVVNNIKTQIINPVILFMFAVAILYFFWGVFKFIQGADSDTARTTGRNAILWGIVGMFVMVSVFSIMWLICNTIQCQGS